MRDCAFAFAACVFIHMPLIGQSGEGDGQFRPGVNLSGSSGFISLPTSNTLQPGDITVGGYHIREFWAGPAQSGFPISFGYGVATFTEAFGSFGSRSGGSSDPVDRRSSLGLKVQFTRSASFGSAIDLRFDELERSLLGGASAKGKEISARAIGSRRWETEWLTVVHAGITRRSFEGGRSSHAVVGAGVLTLLSDALVGGVEIEARRNLDGRGIVDVALGVRWFPVDHIQLTSGIQMSKRGSDLVSGLTVGIAFTSEVFSGKFSAAESALLVEPPPLESFEVPVVVPVDVDFDGLSDSIETSVYHTNPRERDSDQDGLKDGDEVLRYKSNPLDRDTDRDGLSDGQEVMKYGTDPALSDTDAGGASDSLEIARGTDPLEPVDDIQITSPVTFEIAKPIVLEGVLFGTGSDELLPAAASVLNRVVASLRENPGVIIEVQGHTDNAGSKQLNRQLSGRRAEAVRSYLVAHGIQIGRISARGYGSDRPVASNASEEGRALNRRVAFVRIR